MTADIISFAGVGGILIGLVAVGALIFFVSASAEDPSDLSDFLRHKQVKADDIRQAKKPR
ncbi:MAG: hypothetical protein QM780_17120 [Hyphomicrobium sp.]|uniref:hypothetical protein n=1 Tax=Hyphomicrobium sp. TaxID=82 RepID=UPI0039E259F6